MHIFRSQHKPLKKNSLSLNELFLSDLFAFVREQELKSVESCRLIKG
jgi:hypothetical protein